MHRLLLVFLCFGLASCFGAEGGWSAKSAAAYLDGRAQWWMTWPNAARDHDTCWLCCHTAAPYALGRPALRRALEGSGAWTPEQKLVANVTKRVKLWAETKPFYASNEKAPNRSEESRATEAVLNALILAAADAPDVAAAFNNMWAFQIADGANRGAFPWLDFHNRPWEADDSQYYGSALAAVAAGIRPGESTRTEQLVGYLQRGYSGQSLANKAVVLWASAKLPKLLTSAEHTGWPRDLTP